MNKQDATIIGGGLCGNLLAICLAKRGLRVEVLERRAKPASDADFGGRSINLALASRGLAALQRFDLIDQIESLLLPMHGRMIHEPNEAPLFVPYGAVTDCIYSVSRAALNFTLYRIAAELGVAFHFEHECIGLDAQSGQPIVVAGDHETALETRVVFAADGAGSAVRRSLTAAGRIDADESLLEHGYKELSFAPTIGSGGGTDFAVDAQALHIWPRDEYMLIALPNTDKSFTVTLFLSNAGSPGFDSIDADNVESFFAEQFADALPLFENLAGEYARNAVGALGTVRTAPWHVGRCLLIGDAAHAIVPFHGQGMNAAFEDVRELDELLDELATDDFDWPGVFAQFEQRRMRNTNAIADMALENYLEMRASVRDPQFLLQRQLELELERRFPEQFVSRYAMVMFRPDISYAAAQQRGEAQSEILGKLTRQAKSLDDIDFELAAALIRRLPSF